MSCGPSGCNCGGGSNCPWMFTNGCTPQACLTILNSEKPPICCPKVCPPKCCPKPCCPQSIPPCCPYPKSDGPCPPRIRREKRWPQCNFLKPCIDSRIYRNGEHLSISYAGHIPGEQFIHGRNLPTTTTFAKRRLCTYTPYEYVDPDGCCSFP